MLDRIYSRVVIAHWEAYLKRIHPVADFEPIDGHELTLATVVAASRNGKSVTISGDVKARLLNSVKALETNLKDGAVIYGVNTGFGGSADTRTGNVGELQQALLRELHCGVLARGIIIDAEQLTGEQTPLPRSEDEQSAVLNALQSSLDMESFETSTCMPEAWVRASMLIRTNSLISGHSGIRPVVVQRMIDLLTHAITPRVPMRGSISASGDLSPLAYIGGVMRGHKSLEVFHGPSRSGGRCCKDAATALFEHHLTPIDLEAKETLAIVNGTAVSCGVAALVLHDVHGLATLSQVLTAMSVEALLGTPESFDPIFAKVRPHPGQADCANTIRAFLVGSQFASASKNAEAGVLRQDRYSIRTAAQWLGPTLEDILLAHEQILTECNSVTDNPIIDNRGHCWHGGNFQAKSITSAMDKVRQGLQAMGRMLFTQCTEMINPATNKGLAPNLVIDDTDLSFIFKAIDMQIAALLSEISFLANPVGTHVQTAEMGNQALNSLALVAARYTHTATDALSMLAACHILAACQALDLRCFRLKFLRSIQHLFDDMLWNFFFQVCKGQQQHDFTKGISSKSDVCVDAVPLEMQSYPRDLWGHFQKLLDDTTSMNTDVRFKFVISKLQSHLMQHVPDGTLDIVALRAWRTDFAATMEAYYNISRDDYLRSGDASEYLGQASRKMYSYVRGELGIPLLHTAILRASTAEPSEQEPLTCVGVERHDIGCSAPRSKDAPPLVGDYITKLYRAIRKGAMIVPLMEIMQEATEQSQNGVSVTMDRPSPEMNDSSADMNGSNVGKNGLSVDMNGST